MLDGKHSRNGQWVFNGLFLEETHKDYEQTQRDLKEIDILIKQSAAEVERLAQRNSQVTSYTRQLQTNFETLPREDIKEAYEALNDVQQRLLPCVAS